MTVELPLEDPRCPACGADDAEPRFSFPPYRVVRCRRCGLAYLAPRATEASIRSIYLRDDYYEADEAPGYASYRDQELALRLTFRRFVKALARRGVAGGSLLEVGCGHGWLLDEAASWFRRREGTEISAGAARAAAKVADRVHCGGIEALACERRFDLVISNHVIEHVYRPLDFLREQVARLRPGGAVAVTTPWMGSPWQRVLGRRWPSFKVPEHVLYLDRSSLARMMHRAGLVRIRAIPYPHAFPLALVGAKLGLRLPAGLGRVPVWIPGTTLALLGVYEEGATRAEPPRRGDS